MKVLLLAAVFVSLLALGVLGLFYPEIVQGFASRTFRIDVAAASAAVRTYIQSHGSLLSLRAVGIAAFGLCVLLAVNLYRGAR